MNMILLAIPNEIYNYVDSCKTAKEMWTRVERESLVSVYNCFSQLMNDLERNNIKFPTVSVNTKFLNSLQLEWLIYVTQVRLAKRLTVDSFDDLFDYLSQFEKLVNASRAKKLEKSHDPLALVATRFRRAMLRRSLLRNGNATNEMANVSKGLFDADPGILKLGMNATSSVKRPSVVIHLSQDSVSDVSKNEAKKEAVYVRKNKQTYNTFAKVESNKENVIDVVVANASKAKTLLCVSFMQSLGHNLFSVGQFCDGDLEVAFRSKTCYVQNMEGDDLLIGGRDSNLYTISILDMAASSPICLMSKATSTKSWLWHRRLSHLNFGTINDLTKLDLVDGLPKFKYGKDHLCFACERGKRKKASHPPKSIPSDYSKLELLHIDLCGPMRVASVNGKKYILVIVDDFSRFTWVYFLHSKDKTPKIIKNSMLCSSELLSQKFASVRTDIRTEF
ncbi:integrase, catalytic region, zinc finger, CCHC-type containing protein [Tanacetum coccineum]